jgi:hypothetical protein
MLWNVDVAAFVVVYCRMPFVPRYPPSVSMPAGAGK